MEPVPIIAPGTKCSRTFDGERCPADATGLLVPSVPTTATLPYCETCAELIIAEYRDKLGWVWTFKRVVGDAPQA